MLVEKASCILLAVSEAVAAHAHARQEREQECRQAGADDPEAAMERRPFGLDHDQDDANQGGRARQHIADDEQRPRVVLRRRRWFAHPASARSTRSSCSTGFTFRNTWSILPSGPITNVERSKPQYVRPYIDFSTQTPYFSATEWSSSPN